MEMDTEAALREYLKPPSTCRSSGASGRSPARFDFVANAAPGVKEILTVGKLAYEVRREATTTWWWSMPRRPATSSPRSARPPVIRELVQVGMVREPDAAGCSTSSRTPRGRAWSW